MTSSTQNYFSKKILVNTNRMPFGVFVIFGLEIGLGAFLPLLPRVSWTGRKARVK